MSRSRDSRSTWRPIGSASASVETDARGVAFGGDLSVRKEDDLELLKSERDSADREYNDALTRLDRAIQSLPASFPHPPPSLDEHQITPLNTLWKLDDPQAGGGASGMFAGAVRRAVSP